MDERSRLGEFDPTPEGASHRSPQLGLPLMGARRGAASRDVVNMNVRLLASALFVLACGTSVAPTPQLLGDGSTRYWARSTPVAIGTSAAVRLYTHCGFDHAVIDFAGRLWTPLVVPVAIGNEARNAYADPFDDGTITLVGAEHASYVSATAHTILLRPLDGPKDVAPCY